MKNIGRYEILGRLGRGAMSTVYKGRAALTGRLVAIKLLAPRDDILVEIAGRKRLQRIFLEEARIMGALSHDHIAQVLDCGEHQGQPFIVLEYFAHSLSVFIGESYKMEAPSRIISPERARRYLLQALDGLERLHFAGVIHRDLKPCNLMLTGEDRIKIIDFGLSKVCGEENLAIAGMQVGSPYYTASEQRQDPENVDERSDIYSLGVLLYRMLSGQFPEGSALQRVSVARYNGLVDSSWDDFLAQALAKDRSQRFASCQEMRRALKSLPVVETGVCRREMAADVAVCSHPLLRKTPIRMLYKDIRVDLELDELLRPHSYWQADLTIEKDLLVVNRTTNTLWQRRGSGFTLSWEQAGEYLTRLNAACWQGRSDWRLPTLEELRSVMGPPLNGVVCSNWPLFEPPLHWLWSSDSAGKGKAWMADLAGGYFERLDKDGVASVCAVSDS